MHVGQHKNGLTGAGRLAGAALPATRLTCSASQQLHAVQLPGHAKSDGTSKKAPKRLLCLFLSLPCYFGHSPLLFPVPLANSVAFRPAHPRPPAPPPLLPKRTLHIGRLTHGLSQPASLLRGANAPGLRNVSVGLRSPHFAAQTLGYCFFDGCGTLLRGHRATLDSPFRRTA